MITGAAVFDHPVKMESQKELTGFLSELASYEMIEGNFKQTKTIKKLNREFVSTGKFIIWKGVGIYWMTQKPFESFLQVNDSGIAQWDAKGNKKEISTKENPVFAEFSKTIQSVFSGNAKEVEKNFEVYFEKSSKNMIIGLVPREAAVRTVIANLVMEGSKNLEKITITDGDGNPVVYEFSGHVLHKEFKMDPLYIYENMKGK